MLGTVLLTTFTAWAFFSAGWFLCARFGGMVDVYMRERAAANRVRTSRVDA